MPPTGHPPPHLSPLCVTCFAFVFIVAFCGDSRFFPRNAGYQPPPHCQGEEKRFFYLFLYTNCLCSIIIIPLAAPCPLFHLTLYLKEIFLFVVAAVLRFDVFIHRALSRLLPPLSAALFCRVANFPPRCCQFKCFRNYSSLRRLKWPYIRGWQRNRRSRGLIIILRVVVITHI